MKKTSLLLLYCLFGIAAAAQDHYEWAFSCQYDNCYDFYDNRAIITKGRKKGFIDLNGKQRVPPRFNIIDAYSQELASAGYIDFARMTSKSGYVNKAGEVAIDIQYDITSPFEQERACVQVDERWGYIDLKGQYIVEPRYESAQTFSEGLAGVKENGSWGYIDRGGRMAIPTRYEMALRFVDGLCGVKYRGKWGYIKRDGQFAIQPKYSYASNFFEGLARVEKNGKWGLIDDNDQFIIPAKYEMLYHFFEGRARAKLNGKWGYIDLSGQFVIAADYDEAYDFSENLARVKKDGKWGFINPKGEVEIGFIFDKAYDFRQGLSRVILEGKKGYIRYKEPLDSDMKASQVQVEPERLTERKVKNGQRITVTGGQLVIRVYDHKKIDGDIISLNHNGQWILFKHELEVNPYEFQVKLEKGSDKNYLMLFANNTGREPPNTAALWISDGETEQKVILNSDMDTCDIIYFDY